MTDEIKLFEVHSWENFTSSRTR